MENSIWYDALRLGLAFLGGVSIGWERELKDRPAGLKTHALVSLGSAVFVIAALGFIDTEVESLSEPASKIVQYDLLRVIGGIIGGIGFLGGGAILQHNEQVHGLTTAATIWSAAAVGIACGLGQWKLAILATGSVLLVVRGVNLFTPSPDEHHPSIAIPNSDPDPK